MRQGNEAKLLIARTPGELEKRRVFTVGAYTCLQDRQKENDTYRAHVAAAIRQFIDVCWNEEFVPHVRRTKDPSLD